ncbi:MAG TPA: hypothetical protein VHZ52_02300 [Acidobacteriaceae bacterium]|nr:hypothetical protein [Acidobacteriaceae bacterium]
MNNDLYLRNRIAQQILRYLLDHPSAADSGAGVSLWWLRNDFQVSQAIVNEVLESLVQREWLQTHGRDAETRIYRFNTAKADAVKRFTEEPGEGRNG